jgi:hypothetical protein
MGAAQSDLEILRHEPASAPAAPAPPAPAPESEKPRVFTQFGPDPALGTLPAAVQQCLPPNPQSAACDAVIGDYASGAGFCADPAHAGTTYCACVNNSLPCPMIASASCSNAPHSYRNAAMTVDSPEYKYCASHPICVNQVDLAGNQDVARGVVQECGQVTNVKRKISASSATVAVVVFVFLVSLLYRAHYGARERSPRRRHHRHRHHH